MLETIIQYYTQHSPGVVTECTRLIQGYHLSNHDRLHYWLSKPNGNQSWQDDLQNLCIALWLTKRCAPTVHALEWQERASERIWSLSVHEWRMNTEALQLLPAAQNEFTSQAPEAVEDFFTATTGFGPSKIVSFEQWLKWINNDPR